MLGFRVASTRQKDPSDMLDVTSSCGVGQEGRSGAPDTALEAVLTGFPSQSLI